MYPTNLQVERPNQDILLIIDPQVDFHEGGTLAVPGATADAQRIANFITRNKADIGEIFITLDSHHKKHIAHKAFWSTIEDDVDFKGEQPADFTVITNEDLLNEKWFPRDCSLKDYVRDYTRKLENSGSGQFKLIVWPDHCLIGSAGHCIQEDIQRAVRDWDIHHYTKSVKHVHKGMNCLTEMYSAIQAEVPIGTDPTTTKNTELLRELRSCRRLFVCGQARSHCVNFTTRHIVDDWVRHHKDPKYLILCSDGCSTVTGFEQESEAFFNDMRNEGVTIVPMDSAFEQHL